MKIPRLKDDAFLADVVAAGKVAAKGDARATLHLWWIGQSGFLVLWDGHHILVDPYLSDSLSRKYAGTDKPHVRVSERVITPDRLDFIEVVTASHAHTDHLDPDTLQPLARVNPRLVLACPESHRRLARERSGLPDARVVGLDPSVSKASARIDPFTFHAIPSAHEALDRDDAGRMQYLGFIIEAGPFRLYHSGDTVRYPGLEDHLRPYRIDAALLPINGRAPERRVAGNLSGPEAATLARDIGARLVVPCHYDLFEFNTASPEAFVRECERLGQAHRVMALGDRLRLSAAAPAGCGEPATIP